MKKRKVIEVSDADWFHEKYDSIDIEQKREFRKWLKATGEGRTSLMVHESWLDLLLAQEHQKLH